MKKSIILSIIGLTVATTVSHAGSIPFNTYLANNEAGIEVTYGGGWMGPPIGTPIDDTFTGELLYSATPIIENATLGNGDQFLPLNPGWSVGSTGTFNFHYSTGAVIPAGYIAAPNFNYAGSETTLYFEVAAFQGPAYGSPGCFQGHSASFTANLVFGTTLPDPNQLNNLQPFQVFGPVPEPTTLALGGLGFAVFFLFRRKQT
jgi:hypothetical protein